MRLIDLSPKTFVRNIDAGDYLEKFLISSVATVFGIRFFLFLTGYPTVGGDSLHIAHMLWGGLLMFLALTLVLVFLNRSAITTASILGGIGFGTFIDELGKFITNDNNYFFEPTVAILYMIFMLIYLFVRYVDSRSKFSETEYLVNAIEMIKEAVQNDLDRKEKQLALRYLQKCKTEDTFISDLKHILNKADLAESRPTTIISLVNKRLHALYGFLITQRWFVKATLVVFGMSALFTLLASALLVYGLALGDFSTLVEQNAVSVSSVSQFVSSSVSAILVILGGITIFKNRIQGFKLLKFSVLISIFFTQVFAFYDHQFQALTGLSWNIFLYVLIQYYINEEVRLQHTKDR